MHIGLHPAWVEESVKTAESVKTVMNRGYTGRSTRVVYIPSLYSSSPHSTVYPASSHRTQPCTVSTSSPVVNVNDQENHQVDLLSGQKSGKEETHLAD